MRLGTLLLVAVAILPLPIAAESAAPITPVAQVDLPRYMGKWYVIANIPPWVEKGAHNSVENYRLDENGDVETLFTYRKNSFDAPEKTLKSTGIVEEGSGNAVWGIRFLWPFKAEYLVAWLAPDYSQVIVARNKRDYVWVMARTPTMSEADYNAHVARIAALGYDTSKLVRVPQRWSEAAP